MVLDSSFAAAGVRVGRSTNTRHSKPGLGRGDIKVNASCSQSLQCLEYIPSPVTLNDGWIYVGDQVGCRPTSQKSDNPG